MSYIKQTWVNGPEGETPLSAERLNFMEDGIDGVSATADSAIQPMSTIGYQLWNGTAWSARPTGFGHVEAFSDGTRGSTRDSDAPAPTGAVDGDRWWDVDA